MKPYLVDVPVMLNVFVRPDTLKKVFASVKEARPKILFLVGDAPREEVPSDKENIRKSREIVEDIDWECEVHKLYPQENQGMYAMWRQANEYIFSHVDRCIILEDDVVVSQSFFRFCAILLEWYKDDPRVGYISGMNLLEEYNEPSADYLFTTEMASWGYATWKRTAEKYNHAYRNDEYVISRTKMIANIDRKDFKKRIQGYTEDNVYEGHEAGNEYYRRLLEYADNQLTIVPTKNMVCNLGFSTGSVHSPDMLCKMPKATQKLFNMKTFEYNFPLTHPKYMVRDLYYEKQVNRLFAYRKPLIKLLRKIESVCRYIYYGDFARIKNKLVNVLHKNNINYEK
jgi:hypothetical protein